MLSRSAKWLVILGLVLWDIQLALSRGDPAADGVRTALKAAGEDASPSAPNGDTREVPSAGLGKRLEERLEGIENPQLVRVLLDWYGRVASGNARFFFEAAREGNSRRMDALLAYNPDLVHATDSLGRTGLHWAAIGGHVNEVNKMLAFGAVPNARDKDGKTPLDLAVENGHKEIAHLFLRGAIPHKKRVEPKETDAISRLENATIPSATVDHRVPPPPQSPIDLNLPEPDRALRGAVITGEVEQVASLLEQHPDLISSRDATMRWTPLHWGVERNRIEVVQLLLSKGADVHARDVHGWTPLDLARRNGNQKMADLLTDYGANQ